MKFRDIPGHERVKQRLRAMVDNDQVPHALLISGIAGIGKMNLARAMAQYLACTDRHDGDSCGVCAACRQHESFNFPDLHFSFPIVKRTSPKRDLSSDYSAEWQQMLREEPYMPFTTWMQLLDAGNTQPRMYVTQSEEMLRLASLAPYGAEKKVFIIWLPERWGPEVANKLLKIIEEPFEDTVFLLVSNDRKAILPTILSRTQSVEVAPLSADIVEQTLVNQMAIDPERARIAARLSDGSMTTALAQVSRDSEQREFLTLFQDVMRAAYSRNIPKLRDLAEELADGGRDKVKRRLAYFAAMIRENYVYNLQTPELNMLGASEEAFSRNFARFINDANVVQMSEATSEALNDVDRNANAKLVCFDLLLIYMQLIRQ